MHGRLQDVSYMRQFDYLMSYHHAADFFHPMVLYENYTSLVLEDSGVRRFVPFQRRFVPF